MWHGCHQCNVFQSLKVQSVSSKTVKADLRNCHGNLGRNIWFLGRNFWFLGSHTGILDLTSLKSMLERANLVLKNRSNNLPWKSWMSSLVSWMPYMVSWMPYRNPRSDPIEVNVRCFNA